MTPGSTRVGRAILFTALLAGSAAQADPPGKGVLPVHVVAIKSDTSYDQADALTAAIRSRVRGLHGYSLSDGDFALEVLMLGLKCGEVADEACQAKIANQIHADRYFWGTVEHASSNKQVAAELHLWVRGQPPASTRLTYSDNLTAPGDESLRRLVDDALKKLLGTGQPSSGETPALPVAEAAKIKASTTVAVTPVPAVSVLPPPAPPPVADEGSSRHAIGWVGIGIGSLFLGAGLYSLVRLHDISTNEGYQHYLQGFPSNVNACDQANAHVMVPDAASPTEMRDFCSQITTFETLEVIFFGAAAISAGAGIYLLATDPGPRPPPPPRVQMGASVGPGGGDLRLRMRF